MVADRLRSLRASGHNHGEDNMTTPITFTKIIAAVGASALAICACSSGGDLAGGGAGGGSPAGGAAGSSATAGAGASGTGAVIVLPDASANSDVLGTAGYDAVVACTDGDGCICPTLNVAVVGTRGQWGDGSDTAFQDWLNSNSAKTARVDNYPQKPAFTPDFLSAYSLVILAGLGDNSNTGPWWAFSAAEVAAFEDWVENKGGGVISLSGYSNDFGEVSAKNALLGFSGISYREECLSPPCQLFDANNNRMCYRCGNPYQITEWNRDDPVIANLSIGIKMIGFDGGRPISAPADAHVAATTTSTSSTYNWLVGKTVGTGRVLVYADEWIAYTDQWSGQDGKYLNDASCKGFLPEDLYQTAQFWYNMIHWAQPNGNCFKIVDTQQPVTIW
jgi:hypothetical protein